MSISLEELRAENEKLRAENLRYKQDIEKYQSELVSASEQLESMIGHLNKDIQSMIKLQRALVPTEYPNITGFDFSTKFVPSSLSGGDYIDIFEHENKLKFGMIMSSASGYGMSALLLSAFLNYTGQIEARKGAQPDKMTKSIVDDVLETAEPGEVADMFYSYVDVRKYELHYCLLGDINVFHWNGETRELAHLDSTGSAIELEMDQKFSKEKIALNSRDRLILCSPGVIQSKNLEDESFGLQRLVRSINESGSKSVHEIRNEILFQVEQFSQGVESKRDKSVVVAEVKERVLKLAKS